MKKLIIIAALILIPSGTFAMKVGLVSDIHAGTKKNVKMNMGIFQSKIDGIKEKSDIVISCGDEAYNGEPSIYSQMKTMDGIVWVKGDDDGKKYNLAPANFTKGFDGVRVIVMDDTKGSLSKSQISFLKNAENTDKDVIIAMHVPPLTKSVKPDLKKWKTFYPALTPNVKMIVSGHWHAYRKTEWKGIKFIVIPPMFKSQYLIENL